MNFLANSVFVTRALIRNHNPSTKVRESKLCVSYYLEEQGSSDRRKQLGLVASTRGKKQLVIGSMIKSMDH